MLIRPLFVCCPRWGLSVWLSLPLNLESFYFSFQSTGTTGMSQHTQCPILWPILPKTLNCKVQWAGERICYVTFKSVLQTWTPSPDSWGSLWHLFLLSSWGCHICLSWGKAITYCIFKYPAYKLKLLSFQHKINYLIKNFLLEWECTQHHYCEEKWILKKFAQILLLLLASLIT